MPGFRMWWERATRQTGLLARSPDRGASWFSLEAALPCCPTRGFDDAAVAAAHCRDIPHVAAASRVPRRDLRALVAGLGPLADPGPAGGCRRSAGRAGLGLRPALQLGARRARRAGSRRTRGAHARARARPGPHGRRRRMGGVHGTWGDGSVHGPLGRVDPHGAGPPRALSPAGLDGHRRPPSRHRQPVHVRVLARRGARGGARLGDLRPRGGPAPGPVGRVRLPTGPGAAGLGGRGGRGLPAGPPSPVRGRAGRARPGPTASRRRGAHGAGDRPRPLGDRARHGGDPAARGPARARRSRPAMSDPRPSVRVDEGSHGGQGSDRVRAGAAGDGGVRGDTDPVPAVGRAGGGQDRRRGVRHGLRMARRDPDLLALRAQRLRRPSGRERRPGGPRAAAVGGAGGRERGAVGGLLRRVDHGIAGRPGRRAAPAHPRRGRCPAAARAGVVRRGGEPRRRRRLRLGAGRPDRQPVRPHGLEPPARGVHRVARDRAVAPDPRPDPGRRVPGQGGGEPGEGGGLPRRALRAALGDPEGRRLARSRLPDPPHLGLHRPAPGGGRPARMSRRSASWSTGPSGRPPGTSSCPGSPRSTCPTRSPCSPTRAATS